MTKYIISVKSYSRGPGLKPHWVFHIATGESHTPFYQLAGAPPILYYDKHKSILEKTKPPNESIDVGQIDSSELDDFENVVAAVDPRQHVGLDQNTEYGDIRGCRVWCLDCIALLRERGWINSVVTAWTIIEALST